MPKKITMTFDENEWDLIRKALMEKAHSESTIALNLGLKYSPEVNTCNRIHDAIKAAFKQDVS